MDGGLRTTGDGVSGRGLRHDALLYTDDQDYLDAIRAFVAAGRAADEPVLVAVPAHRLSQVGAVLDAPAGVTLADMSAMGRNPAAIIPNALREFVHRFPGRRLRIVGESLWPGRRPAAYRHCVEHEAMINLALGAYPLSALCLFDRSRLPADALADVGRTHPVVRLGAVTRPSAGYQHPEEVLAGCAQALPPPPPDAATRRVAAADLAALRAAVAATAVAAGLPSDRVDDLRIAVTELAANVITRRWARDRPLVGGGAGRADLRGQRRRGDQRPARRPAPDPDLGRAGPRTAAGAAALRPGRHPGGGRGQHRPGADGAAGAGRAARPALSPGRRRARARSALTAARYARPPGPAAA